jgi:hypothetical protein
LLRERHDEIVLSDVIDRDYRTFSVEGPMTDDREWNHAVVVAEKSGRPAKPPHPSGSHLTHRWRERDSNHRYPAKKQL